MDSCATCGKTEHIFKCSGCKQVKYCNKECQGKHWTEHKQLCKLGERVPVPPTPPQKDIEALMFPTLFPYGRGHFDIGTPRAVPITIDEYVRHCLALADPRFRNSREWLCWALTRVEYMKTVQLLDEGLKKHGVKARHLGEGKVDVNEL